MKIRIQKTIGFNEVDTRHNVRLKHLFNYLQEAAATHSHQVGCGTGALLQKGYAWVLNKVGLTINRLPKLCEAIEVVTWHKGVRGFRSYRDYQIRIGEEILVSATSLWLFIDVEKKKIIKPPADVGESYTIETDAATDLDLDAWRPAKSFEPEHKTIVSTRPSDFDPLGHVNNAAYLDFLEVVLKQNLNAGRGLKQLRIQYLNEVPAGAHSVIVSLGREHEGRLFSMSSEEGCFAVGELF